MSIVTFFRRVAALTCCAALWAVLAPDSPSARATDVGQAVAARTALPERNTVLPVIDCRSVATLDFTTIEGAPTSIASATIEPATEGRAEFCLVKGIIAPQIQFELRLPTKTYTGRYLQGGCAGACGLILNQIVPGCDESLAFGGAFAVAFENSGHVGASMIDTLWAMNAPALREDFAHRAAHVTSVVAKQVIAAYYGAPPAHSYFQGCSNGGREGLKEAQMYPDDFDGIVVGAPAYWVTLMPLRVIWESQHGLDERGKRVLTDAAVSLLHRAVIGACDGLDGLADGQIDDPRACRFNPGRLACRPGRRGDCLTPRQVATARAFYQGPVDAEGRQLYLGGEPYGSELTWTQPFSSMGGTLGAQQIRFMIYDGQPPAGFDWRTWRPDRAALAELFERAGYFNAIEPDLRQFRESGGKLLVWQGAADNAAGSHAMFEYYQNVRDAMGGFPGTDPFMRVFEVPGVYHCSDGYIPYRQSYLGAMVEWVERGQAPERILVSATLADGKTRVRPVYPYPLRAKYKGRGDINRPESFVPAAPTREPDDNYDWLGAEMR